MEARTQVLEISMRCPQCYREQPKITCDYRTSKIETYEYRVNPVTGRSSYVLVSEDNGDDTEEYYECVHCFRHLGNTMEEVMMTLEGDEEDTDGDMSEDEDDDGLDYLTANPELVPYREDDEPYVGEYTAQD